MMVVAPKTKPTREPLCVCVHGMSDHGTAGCMHCNCKRFEQAPTLLDEQGDDE